MMDNMAEKKNIAIAVVGIVIAIVVAASIFLIIQPNDNTNNNEIFEGKYFLYDISGTDEDGDEYGGTVEFEVVKTTNERIQVKFTFNITKGGVDVEMPEIAPQWIRYTDKGPGGTFVEAKTITGTPWGDVDVKGYRQVILMLNAVIFGGVDDAVPYELQLNVNMGGLKGLLIGSLKDTDFLP